MMCYFPVLQIETWVMWSPEQQSQNLNTGNLGHQPVFFFFPSFNHYATQIPWESEEILGTALNMCKMCSQGSS